MNFYLFPFFINSLSKRFKGQFEANPKDDFPWAIYQDGRGLDVSQENYEAYQKYFIQSLYWASFSLCIAIAILVYIYLQSPAFPISIMYLLYAAIAFLFYYKSVLIVEEGFYKPYDSELWIANLDQKFGKTTKIKLDSPSKVWWEMNKHGVRYLAGYFSILAILHKYAEGIKPEHYPILILCTLILIATIVWWLIEVSTTVKEEEEKQIEQQDQIEGDLEWEAYERELGKKINPKKSKKKKKKALKKQGKVILKRYKGPTTKD